MVHEVGVQMKLRFERSNIPEYGEWYFIWYDSKESKRLVLTADNGFLSEYSSWFFCVGLREWFMKWVFK